MAAPKKKAKGEENAAEEVEPKTPGELAEDYMADMMKSLNVARSHAIKLTNVPYGKDLADSLLKFAVGMESLYKKMQQCVDTGNTAKLVQYHAEAQKKEETEGAAKAGKSELMS